MTRADAELAALIGSRICHDLISPLGAIANGLELLELSGSTLEGPEMALIGESAGNATARIRLFRVAFGAAAPEQRIAASELRALVGDIAAEGRLTVDWTPPDALPRPEAKLILLLMLCLETALAWGGEIAVTGAEGGWELEGRGDRLRVDPELWGRLAAPDDGRGVTAAEVQFLLAPLAAAEIGRKLAVETGDGRIRIRV